MEYNRIKDILYKSKEIGLVVDNWHEGIPFLIDENLVFDSFLYYTTNKKESEFNKAKLLILINSLTGELFALNESDISKKYKIKSDFKFKAHVVNSFQEYYQLMKNIEKSYSQLREKMLSGLDCDNYKKAYLNEIRKIVPPEILENVYQVLSPDFFYK